MRETNPSCCCSLSPKRCSCAASKNCRRAVAESEPTPPKHRSFDQESGGPPLGILDFHLHPIWSRGGGADVPKGIPSSDPLICFYDTFLDHCLKDDGKATCYGRRQFTFYPFLLQVTLVFGDSMTKFQLTSYKLNKCPKHPTIHSTIRKRANLTDSHQDLNSFTIWVQFSTNSKPMRILVEIQLLTNRFSVFDTQVTWEFGLFPSSKEHKTLAWPETSCDQFVSISSTMAISNRNQY